jgi:hypothetical protein
MTSSSPHIVDVETVFSSFSDDVLIFLLETPRLHVVLGPDLMIN